MFPTRVDLAWPVPVCQRKTHPEYSPVKRRVSSYSTVRVFVVRMNIFSRVFLSLFGSIYNKGSQWSGILDQGERESIALTDEFFLTCTEQFACRFIGRSLRDQAPLGATIVAGLTPLQYLNKHVCVTSGRKLIFGRIFAKFNEETSQGERRISPNDVEEALQEVVGKALTDEQRSYLRTVIGEITESLNFREWCGLCAVVERLLCPLPPKASDPPTWLERADFEALERRLKSAEVDSTLALLLKEIRDR